MLFKMRTSTLHAAIAISLLFAIHPGYAQAGSRSDQERPETVASRTPAPTQSASRSAPHDATYVIGRNDLLAISVWNEKDISRSVPVRSDGKISLPLVGEVQASGRTPLQLEQEITTRLLNYITEPQVSVIVEEINSRKFNILGEVEKPGSYSITLASTVVDAIALAGGFRDFAKKKDIHILRQNADGTQSRLSFNYKDFIKGKSTSQNVHLEPHDTIIVP